MSGPPEQLVRDEQVPWHGGPGERELLEFRLERTNFG